MFSLFEVKKLAFTNTLLSLLRNYSLIQIIIFVSIHFEKFYFLNLSNLRGQTKEQLKIVINLGFAKVHRTFRVSEKE